MNIDKKEYYKNAVCIFTRMHIFQRTIPISGLVQMLTLSRGINFIGLTALSYPIKHITTGEII